MENLLNTILQNQIVTGLSVTAVLGGIAFQLRRVPAILYDVILRSFTVKLTVDSRDAVFLWIDKWLSAQPYAKRTHMVTLRSENIGGLSSEDDDQKWILTPGYGSHWFWWCGRLIVIQRGYEDIKDQSQKPVEKIEFRTIGRSQQILRDVVSEAYELIAQRNLVAIRIWRGWWASTPGKAPRSLDTLTLKAGQKDRIIADLIWFGSAKDWYIERGIPYRRGYLFAGPPGTGKTSIVLAIAAFLKRPVCVLNLGSVENDDKLFSAVADAPQGAIVLLEDIDCASPTRSRELTDQASQAPGALSDAPKGVTKAGLLNALDGITTPDGRIFIMTTNYPDRLDDALIRPGRADVRETFDHLGPVEQIAMAQRFYGGLKFQPLDCDVSPAAMRAAFMSFPDDQDKARAALVEPEPKIKRIA